MNRLPAHCNTKADYEYIREANIEGWEVRWRQLLEGRWVVDTDELIEDPRAKIFQLGFVVAEVEAAIGFTGLTDREIEWRQAQPDRWRQVDGAWQEINGWAEARAASRIAQAVADKITEVEAESQRRQLLDIEWSGHRWCADAWATRTIESCHAVAVSLGMAASDPVRVPPPLQPGNWMTADFDTSGNRVIVPMTVAQMRQLLAALYDRNGAIWGKEVIHKATIEAMVAEGAAADDIVAYNHLSGWE